LLIFLRNFNRIRVGVLKATARPIKYWNFFRKFFFPFFRGFLEEKVLNIFEKQNTSLGVKGYLQ